MLDLVMQWDHLGEPQFQLLLLQSPCPAMKESLQIEDQCAINSHFTSANCSVFV